MPYVWKNTCDISTLGYGNNTNLNFNNMVIELSRPCSSIFVILGTADSITNAYSGCRGLRYSVCRVDMVAGNTVTMTTKSENYGGSHNERTITVLSTTEVQLGTNNYSGLTLPYAIIDGSYWDLLAQFTQTEVESFASGAITSYQIDLSGYSYVAIRAQRSTNQANYIQYEQYNIIEVNGVINILDGVDNNSRNVKYVRISKDGIELSAMGASRNAGPGMRVIYGYR